MVPTQQFSVFLASYYLCHYYIVLIQVVSYIGCVCVCIHRVFHMVYSVVIDMLRSFVADCSPRVISLLVFEFSLIFIFISHSHIGGHSNHHSDHDSDVDAGPLKRIGLV